MNDERYKEPPMTPEPIEADIAALRKVVDHAKSVGGVSIAPVSVAFLSRLLDYVEGMRAGYRYVKAIANAAEGFSRGSGVPGVDIAGLIVSCAANDKKFCDAFFANPTETLISSDRFDGLRNGCLSYIAQNGQHIDPLDMCVPPRSLPPPPVK